MNRLFIVASVLVFTLSAQRAGAKMREFTSADGRSLQAEIVSFNGTLGKVKLKLADGRIKTVKPAIFVEADRKYIKEWAALDGFRNPSFFKISCRKDQVEKWKEDLVASVYTVGDRSNSQKDVVGEMKFEKYAYKLVLENRNAVPLENIGIEYCIFSKQKGKGRWFDAPEWFETEKKGSLTIVKLPAKSKKNITTDTTVIGKQEILGDFVQSYEKVEVEMEGIWVRITLKTPGGQTATRTVFDPENLKGKHAWPE